MRYTCIAFDYDGTLAIEGKMNESLLCSLGKVKASGRNLILITGRILKDLYQVFPELDIFDYIVAENGAVLYSPATRIKKLLCEPIPNAFVRCLHQKGVNPVDVGNVIVASWHPNENLIIEAIHEFGLDLHISFNKGAVMVLPAGVNKATGLRAALDQLGHSVHNTIGVGDGENDFVLLDKCEYSVAVANALPVLKELADLTLSKDNGHGVEEFLDEVLLVDQLEEAEATRHRILIGYDQASQEIRVPSYNCNILIAGPSQSGKSSACMALLNQLSNQDYQFCLIDPEGEYDQAPHSVIVGNEHYAPEISDILRLLLNPSNSVVVNLLGVPLNERPNFFSQILSALHELKRKNGRPHFLVVDEAHHMLHPYWNSIIEPAWLDPISFIAVTVDPLEISKSVLKHVDLLLSVGNNPVSTMDNFARALDLKPVSDAFEPLSHGQAEAWFCKAEKDSIRMNLIEAPMLHRRHLRKYAEGNLGRERSFYFTGKDGKLKVRCQNLFLFMQVGEGLDDETWLYHLHRGDYSSWIKDSIHDPELASEIRAIESNLEISPCQSRELIRKSIEKRYSLPARLF